MLKRNLKKIKNTKNKYYHTKGMDVDVIIGKAMCHEMKMHE